MNHASTWLKKQVHSAATSKLFIFCAALLLAACSGPRLDVLSDDATILAFGDSLTAGTGVSSENSYPAVLARLLQRKVINAGVPGEVTEDGKVRLPGLLDEYSVQLVVICHGGNDFLHRLPEDQTEANLRAMISEVKSRGIDVVLIAVPIPGIWANPPELYNRLAREFDVPLDENILGKLEADPAMKSDPVHLNQPGYQRMAEAVVSLLVAAGAVAES